jgi:tRNA threonylcarbamoyladenosine modification (KEOPS) complex  Pcc1 subunit
VSLLRQQDALQDQGHCHEDQGKMNYRAVITADDGALYRRLIQDGDSGDRSKVKITGTKLGVRITITAKDVTALRASANGIMRLLAVDEKMRENG